MTLREFRCIRISNPVDRKDAMIIYGGKGIARLKKSLPDPVDVSNEYNLFDLILYIPSTIFQLNRGGSSSVEPVLS